MSVVSGYKDISREFSVYSLSATFLSDVLPGVYLSLHCSFLYKVVTIM